MSWNPFTDFCRFEMRCLVTGATGFIGSHLCRRLLQEDNELSILIRSGSNTWRIADILGNLNVIHGDMTALRLVREQLLSFEPEVIFHLAWQGGNSSKYLNDPTQIHRNVFASVDLLELCMMAGAVRWIGIGTSLEYGKYDKPIDESTIPEPQTLYGISKYCVCMLTQKICQLSGLDFVWFRPFWTYGPRDDPLRMIPFVILKLLRGERPSLTPGEQLWDYLYIDDVVEAIWQTAKVTRSNGIFNLCSGEVHPIRSIVERIRDLIDPSLSLGFGELPYPPDQIMLLQSNPSRLRQITGWSPKISLDEGLGRTVEWYRDHREYPSP